MNKTLLQLGMKYDDGDQKSDNERGEIYHRQYLNMALFILTVDCFKRCISICIHDDSMIFRYKA